MNNDKFIKDALSKLAEKDLQEFTSQRKEKIFNNIIIKEETSRQVQENKLILFLFNRPYFASLTIAVSQSLICLLIWGTEYTNLLLKLIGGM